MPKNTRNLASFRAQFDRSVQIRKRLKEALAALAKKGKEAWVPERELLDAAKVSTKDIGNYREEFSKHIIAVPGNSRLKAEPKRIWFANIVVAKKVRLMQEKQ